MLKIIKFIFVSFFLILIFSNNKVAAESESEELTAILEVIKKDIKTLEKAVYLEGDNSLSNNSFDGPTPSTLV